MVKVQDTVLIEWWISLYGILLSVLNSLNTCDEIHWCNDWSFVCIYERPILGDNPKPHKFAWEKRCAFHFSLCFSLKSTMLFTVKHCTFYFLLHFSLKSTVLFTFHWESTVAFHWKALHFSLCFSLFAVLFCEKHKNIWFNTDLSVWPGLS